MKKQIISKQLIKDSNCSCKALIKTLDFTKSVPCGTLGVLCDTESVSCGIVHQSNGPIFKRVSYNTPSVPCDIKGVSCGTVSFTNSSKL